MHFSKPRRATAVFFALVSFFVVIRLWNIETFCLDSDEVWSLTCARSTWSGLLSNAAYDLVHPPLFYMLLKLWVPLGGIGLLWLRLLPAALSFASLVPFYFLCRRVGLGGWQTNLALAFLTVNADQVFHSQYLRMYSLLFLLSLCSYLAFVMYLTDASGLRLVVLGAVNVLLVYTHYYGWAVVACEGLCALIVQRRRLFAFMLMSAAVVAAFSPWLIAVMRFAAERGGLKDNLGWIRRPHLFDLFKYYATLIAPADYLIFSAAFLILCAGLMFAGLRLDGWKIPLMLIGALLPPLVSFGISQVNPQSVWGTRHLIVAVTPFYILIAIAAARLPFHRMRAAVVAVASIWFVVSLLHVSHPRPRVNYEVLAELMAARERGDDRVELLVPDRYLAFPMRFHLEQHDPGRWDVETLASLDDAAGSHFWVAYHRERWKGDSPVVMLERRGYRVGQGVWVKDDYARIIAFPVWRDGRTGDVKN